MASRPLVDQILTNVSNAVQPEGLLAETLLPEIKVKRSTGKLLKYGLGHLRLVESRIVGRGRAARIQTMTRDTQSYEMESHGLEGLVTRDDYRNQDQYDAERDETVGLTTTLAVSKEVALATALADTTNVVPAGQFQTLTGEQQFSDGENSEPLEVFLAAHEAVRPSGMYPNAAWMDEAVSKVLKRHPDLFKRLGITYNQTGYMTNQQLAEALEVETLLIAKGMYNSGKKGLTDSLVPIWGKHLFFGVIPKKAAPYQTSLGYRLTYEGTAPRKVTKWPENNPPGSTAILVDDEYCQFLSNLKAFYVVKNCIA